MTNGNDPARSGPFYNIMVYAPSAMVSAARRWTERRQRNFAVMRAGLYSGVLAAVEEGGRLSGPWSLSTDAGTLSAQVGTVDCTVCILLTAVTFKDGDGWPGSPGGRRRRKVDIEPIAHIPIPERTGTRLPPGGGYSMWLLQAWAMIYYVWLMSNVVQNLAGDSGSISADTLSVSETEGGNDLIACWIRCNVPFNSEIIAHCQSRHLLPLSPTANRYLPQIERISSRLSSGPSDRQMRLSSDAGPAYMCLPPYEKCGTASLSSSQTLSWNLSAYAQQLLSSGDQNESNILVIRKQLMWLAELLWHAAYAVASMESDDGNCIYRRRHALGRLRLCLVAAAEAQRSSRPDRDCFGGDLAPLDLAHPSAGLSPYRPTVQWPGLAAPMLLPARAAPAVPTGPTVAAGGRRVALLARLVPGSDVMMFETERCR